MTDTPPFPRITGGWVRTSVIELVPDDALAPEAAVAVAGEA
jgi:hypothetical protein